MSQASKGFSVFLSYNLRDRETVRTIARGLEARGLKVFLDEWSLQPGFPWPETLQAALVSCNGVIVVLGRQALGPWQQKEVNLALERQVREPSSFPVVPVLLPGADPPLSFLGLNTWIDWRNEPDGERLEGLTEKLIEALHWRAPSQRKTSQPQPLDTSPYRGLLPFREEDASFYYGRESFVLSLGEAVKKNSLTALVGPSGSGKSSLVHAGLLPHLRKTKTKEFWQAVPMRPGPHPISSLASALVPLLGPGKPEDQRSAADRFAASLLRREESLESLSMKALKKAGGEGMLLLVVDQWEELYTLAEDNKSERERFIEEILTATLSSSISVLILFRGDFYGRVMEQPEFRRRLQGECLIPLPDMSPADLKKAVEEPAQKVGLSFDDGLVAEILRDLEQQPGQLPLLQYVLARLWSERDKEKALLLRDSYVAMGRLKGALARTADEITHDLPEAEVRRLFLRLVQVEEDAPATRRRAPLDELDQQSYAMALPFIENRLLVTGWDARTGDEIVEIAHGALIHHWRRLRVWLREDRAFLIWRDQLRHDLVTWFESDQKEAFLLTAGPLQVAEFWLENHSDDLSAEAFGYIRLGLEKRGREQRRGKLLRAVAVVFVIALLGLGSRVLYLRTAQAHARSAALAAEATRLADRKLDLALLLALQANKIMPTAEAREVTLSLTAGNPVLRHFLRRPERFQQSGHEEQREEILATAFGPGDLIATGGTGRVFLWDAKQGTLRGSPLETGEPSQVVSLAFSPDGSILASGSEVGDSIHLWNLQEGQKLDPIPTDGATQYLAFGPRGVLAWTTPSGIHVWDMARRVYVTHLPKPEKGDWVSGLAFRPSGELVWATAAGRITLWEPENGRQLRVLAEPEEAVMGVAFAPEGSLLAAGSSFRRWDLSSGKTIGESCNLLSGSKDAVISVAFSQDRRFVASTHFDRKIRLWDVSKKGCPLFTTLSGHSGLIWSIAFGAERPGRRLALISGGEEGDLILWEADPQAPTFSIPLGTSPRGLATLAVSPDGSLVAVGEPSGQVTLYDGKSREELDSKKGRDPIVRMAFRADGRVLATGCPEGHVHLWDVGERNLRVSSLLRAPGGRDPIRSLAFSRDRSWFVAGTKTGRLLVWQPEVSTTPTWIPQKLYNGPILAMAFITEPSAWSKVRSFLHWKQKEYLVVGGPDGSLTLWDLDTRKRVHAVEVAHSRTITSLAVSPDGLLASGSLDRSVRLWWIDNGLQPQDTLFLGWRITDLDLSSQGKLLAAAGEEGSDSRILLWDLEARTPFRDGFQAPGIIRRVAFGPSSQSLFIGGEGVSSWWDLRPETWSDRACDMVRRGFYPIERETYLKASERPEVCGGLM